MGKLRPIPKVSIADPTLEGLQQRAASCGMSFSEYVRTVLEGHVHGPAYVARLAADRVRSVLGMEPEKESS